MKIDPLNSHKLPNTKLKLPMLMAIGILSCLVAYSYYWNVSNIYKERVNLALAEAKSNWNKDAAFRKWATLHGGVYVKPDKRTPPNPYLAHLPDRDIITQDGTKLTLMNPAYMMREMTQEFAKGYGVMGKITGKIQLNPDNKPDQWQFDALTLFESGKANETYEQQNIDGQPYLRYMKAMYMTGGCTKCHGHLGFKYGDLRGGVSVSIPLSPYFHAASKIKERVFITHLIIWIVGLLGIAIFIFLIKKLLSKMAHKALHDDLTNLPNISLFKNRLAQSLNKYRRDDGYNFAVLFMDLDRFKNLNDSHGHSAGDELLIELSSRLQKLLRPCDTLARMGGDEFTFLLDNINGIDGSLAMAERILSIFTTPFTINSEAIYSNASIGICMASKEYTTCSDMIRNADIAMFRAKKSGKGRIDVFNPDMHHYALETMQIENDLRNAIKNKQLFIHYQPVIDVKNNTIEGFEALLRWRHPILGNISPERFIPIAESIGQIEILGKWVLEKACLQVHKWNKQFSPEKKLTIAINLSGVQVISLGLGEMISEVLKSTNIDASTLYLEVTETMLVKEKDRAKASIKEIRELGVSASIDDFGKGYCSLSYLQEFEFDVLKIDKDFVQDMEQDSKGLQLVRILMLLASDFKMKVIAEGVETEDQFNLLKSMKCPYVQGYYFSRPLSVEQINGILADGCHLNANLLLRKQLLTCSSIDLF